MDRERTDTEAVPLFPDHRYDLPGGPHLGHAAALNVPCSEGPSALGPLDRDDGVDCEPVVDDLPIEPGRQMEAGTTYDAATVRRLAGLFTPLHPIPVEP